LKHRVEAEGAGGETEATGAATLLGGGGGGAEASGTQKKGVKAFRIRKSSVRHEGNAKQGKTTSTKRSESREKRKTKVEKI